MSKLDIVTKFERIPSEFNDVRLRQSEWLNWQDAIILTLQVRYYPFVSHYHYTYGHALNHEESKTLTEAVNSKEIAIETIEGKEKLSRSDLLCHLQKRFPQWQDVIGEIKVKLATNHIHDRADQVKKREIIRIAKLIWEIDYRLKKPDEMPLKQTLVLELIAHLRPDLIASANDKKARRNTLRYLSSVNPTPKHQRDGATPTSSRNSERKKEISAYLSVSPELPNAENLPPS